MLFSYEMRMIRFGFVLFALSSFVQAQTSCSGTLSGNFDSISVSGGSCRLNSVTVTGSVAVSSGASLTISGASTILGSVGSSGGGNINIRGTTSVSGDVSVSDSSSTSVTVGPNAVLTSLNVENSGTTIIRGTVGSVGTKSSGAVRIIGGTITSGGLLVEIGSGNINLCNANITGSVSITETTGNLATDTSCSSTIITGSINIEKGQGNVQLDGANISSGDVSVVEQTGDISISSSSVSDVSIEKSTGDINLISLTTDSDVSIIENDGSIDIRGSTFSGDVGLNLNSAVSVRNSKFSGESVSIGQTSGPVTFIGNSEGSVSISGGRTTTIANNNLNTVSVEKNEGVVTINNNQIQTLTCVDNVPPPTGSGNSVALLADGQCAGF